MSKFVDGEEYYECRHCGRKSVPICNICGCPESMKAWNGSGGTFGQQRAVSAHPVLEVGFGPKDMKRDNDPVNSPAHYNFGKIEVAEFIEDQQLDWHCGSAVKYICRAGRKDPTKYEEDLKKAIWYLRRRLELLKPKPKPRRPNEMKTDEP